MNLFGLMSCLAILATATSNPIAAPTPSTLSCHDDICTDGREQFYCWQRRLVCCQGRTSNSFQVFAQRHGFECCEGAGKLFESQREICVSGQIQPKGQDEENCGDDKIYNTSNQVCCDGNVFSKVEGAECCGDEYLTDDTQSCCNGNIKFNTYEQVCCQRLENDPALGREQLFNIPYGKCCLDKPYNPRNQSCIEDESGFQLIDTESREMRRCSGEGYDPNTHGCCRGESTTVYEHRRMLCRMGNLYEKTDPHQDSLCVYNYVDDEGIQREKVIPYTKNSRTGCISSQGVVSLGPLEETCGNDIYNKSTDLCCSGKRYTNMKIAGFQCCLLTGTKMFNPAREICCLNQVSKMVYNDGGRCCNREPYSTATHECRGGRVTEKACPSYGNKCNISVPILKRMKKRYVYFGIAGEMTVDRSSRRRDSRQWPISDLKTLKFKKGKVTVVKTKSKGVHFLKSTECGCPENLAAGARYMFVSSQPVKRKTLSLESADNGFVLPIEDKQQIGLVFETIIKKSK